MNTIRASVPNANVVMLTSSEDQRLLMTSVMAGAHTLLLKRGGTDILLRAARAASRGQSLMDPDLIQRALNGVKQQAPAQHSLNMNAALSKRERDVLALIAQMKTNKQIAQTLVISENTVKTHVSHIMRKLNLHDRHDIAALAPRQPTP